MTIAAQECDFWADGFHYCALVAGFIAHSEGRLSDSAYVKALAYKLYEQERRNG